MINNKCVNDAFINTYIVLLKSINILQGLTSGLTLTHRVSFSQKSKNTQIGKKNPKTEL